MYAADFLISFCLASGLDVAVPSTAEPHMDRTSLDEPPAATASLHRASDSIRRPSTARPSILRTRDRGWSIFFFHSYLFFFLFLKFFFFLFFFPTRTDLSRAPRGWESKTPPHVRGRSGSGSAVRVPMHATRASARLSLQEGQQILMREGATKPSKIFFGSCPSVSCLADWQVE